MFDDYLFKECEESEKLRRKNIFDANKEDFEKLRIAFEKNELEKCVMTFSYERVYELLDMLDFFEENLLVCFLKGAMINYVHELENATFLEMYEKYKNGDFDIWLSNASFDDLKKVKMALSSCDKDDKEMANISNKINRRCNI